MNFVDQFSLSLHRAIAEKLVADEAGVLLIARRNLDRWLKSPGFEGRSRRPLLEWKQILENSNTEAIRRILTAETEEGQRLRSSSPFVGVLTEAERDKHFRSCAHISTV